MNDIVSEHEHGVIRVFQGSYQLEMEIGHMGTYDRLCRAIGINRIGDKDVQTLNSQSLDGMLLSDFLKEAYDVQEDDIAPHRDALNGIEGLIVIMRSSAFLDRPATIVPNDDVEFVAALREGHVETSVVPPIITKSAEGILTPPAKKTPSDAAMSGRIATVALLVMALLVWVMIKLGG